MVGRLPGKSAFHVGEGTVSVVCNHVSSRESYIHPIMVALELPIYQREARYVSSKESNVTGVIFDLFFMIKTRPVLAGKLALVLAGRWVSLKESNVILRISN